MGSGYVVNARMATLKLLKHVIDCEIDNITNAPQKPSDNKAWHAGFRECYDQIMEVIDCEIELTERGEIIYKK